VIVSKISDLSPDELGGLAQRGVVMPPVQALVEDVRDRGDRALREYTKKFDGVKIEDIQVSEQEIDAALTPPTLTKALAASIRNIGKFHEAQLPGGIRLEIQDGVTAGQRIIPLHRVGAYVPGGRALYPSSVIMCAVPAKVAGVDEVIMCTPPNKDGAVDPIILVAAKLSGVSQIFKVGGAQAIAAMAYGTETIPRVDKIVGPGNKWVTAAKLVVYGAVDIDFPAGPSEVMILADEKANAAWIAADLIAQAEHDPLASASLITTSTHLASRVREEIDKQIGGMPRAEVIRQALEGGAILIASSLREAIDFVNECAPEHLEIMTADPSAILGDVRNAGSVFLGEYAPVSVGDYCVGPNHVLPTAGFARARGGLGVCDFVKRQSYQALTKKGLDGLRETAVALAQVEGLDAHAKAIEMRFR